MDGKHAVIEQLIKDGFEYMFGLPGSEEEGFLDVLSDYSDRLSYILAYQETVAVMAADAYARASGRPALVQVHSTPGLGNALGGAVWEASKGNSPLVIIGGKAGVRYLPMEAHMAGDVVGMARPVTKWAAMVSHRASLLRMLRRAIKIAATAPAGPVYLCLPMDILDQEIADIAAREGVEFDEQIRATYIPDTRVSPDAEVIRTAADWLASANKPMIFIGDGVAFSDAHEELRTTAELLGAEVWGVHMGELTMSYDHPLFQGLTGRMFGSDSKKIFSRGDAILICGTYVVSEVFPDLGDVFAKDARVIHIDLDADNIGKNHAVDLAVVSDPKRSLGQLAQQLRETITVDQQAAAEGRTTEIAAAKRLARDKELAADAARRNQLPLHFSQFAEALAAELANRGTSALIFDEALTCSADLTRYVIPREPRHYFLPRGGCLGIGLPGAIGAKVAQPDKTVIGFSGDGGAMEVIQALATAARHDIQAKFVICNNRKYKVCELNLSRYREDLDMDVGRAQPASFDLSRPELDFVKLADGQGVNAMRVDKPEQIGPAIKTMLDHDGPFLLDVMVA